MVAGWPDVGAAEGEHEIHVGAPVAESFDGGDFGFDFFVSHLGPLLTVDLAGVEAVGEVFEIAGFGSGDAGCSHLFDREGEEGFGGDLSAGEGFEASVDGGCGFTGELLEDDGPGQAVKGVGDEFEFGGGVFGDERGEMGVGFEVLDGFLDFFGVFEHGG